jgi:hypothetical protein
LLPLAEQQRAFAAAIRAPHLGVPEGLVGPDGKPSLKRFSVYRNNVIVGLIETLRETFPSVEKIVGSDFFTVMAGRYAVSEPPQSPIMLHYGAGFPDFIATFEPASSLIYLADVARIERGWAESYHAAEASALDPAELREVATEHLAGLRFAMHPSLRIVRSKLPALSIWQMNTDGGEAAPIDLESGGEDVLILRPEAEVELRLMSKGSAEFLMALASGGTVASALRAAATSHELFDLASNLSGLFEVGAFSSWHSEPKRNQTATRSLSWNWRK